MRFNPINAFRTRPPAATSTRGRGAAWWQASRLRAADGYLRAGALLVLLVAVIGTVAYISGRGSRSAGSRATNTSGVPQSASVPRSAGTATDRAVGSTPASSSPHDAGADSATWALFLSPADTLRLEPGFPSGIPVVSEATLLLLEPGFPGGVSTAATQAPLPSPPQPPEPPAAASAPSGPALQQPVAPPLSPAQPTSLTPPAAPVSAAAASPAPPVSGVPQPPSVAPPVAASAPSPVTAGAPPPADAVNPGSAVPAPVNPSAPPATPDDSAGAAGTAASPASPTSPLMTLDVTVLSAAGAPLNAPRAQAYVNGTLCADETAVDADARSVRLTLPGACRAPAPGSAISVRAGGLDRTKGPVTPPLPACPVAQSDAATGGGAAVPEDRALAYQADGQGAAVTVQLGVAPRGGCPAGGLSSAPGVDRIDLSVSVYTADGRAPLGSPSVRVYAGSTHCGEASSVGSVVVHLQVLAACAGGGALRFEAGGLDTGRTIQLGPALACPFETAYGAVSGGAPAYVPVSLVSGAAGAPRAADDAVARNAAGEQSVALVLAALTGCPRPGDPPAAAPGDVTLLTVRLLDPALPEAPLARPTVAVYAGNTICARQVSLDAAAISFALPRSCGADGTALSFRVSSLDPRSAPRGETAACAVDLPGDTAARPFRATPRSVSLHAGAAQSVGLVADPALCGAVTATGSAAATPAPSVATATPVPSVAQPAPATVPPATSSPSPTATATPFVYEPPQPLGPPR